MFQITEYFLITIVLFTFSRITQHAKSDERILYTNSTGVLFNTHVRYNFSTKLKDIYSEKEIQAMLEVISTRFSRIMTIRFCTDPSHPSESLLECDSADLIPNAAAKLNNLNSLKKIDVWLTVHKRANEPHARVNMDYAWNLATKANQIYPNTVSALLLDAGHIGPTVATTIKAIKHAKRLRQSYEATLTNRNIKIGILLPLVDCGISPLGIPKYSVDVLQHLDIVVFHKDPSVTQFQNGPKRAVEEITAEFAICEKRIRDYFNTTLMIFLSTAWPSARDIPGSSLQNQIIYWQLMSKWAAQKGTVVYFRSAFDYTYKISWPEAVIYAQEGWWKLGSKRIVNITKDVFIEKASLINSTDEGDNEPINPGEDTKSPSMLSFSSITVISMSLFGLTVLAITASLTIFYYTKVKALTKLLSKNDYDNFFNGSIQNSRTETVNNNCLEILDLPYNREMELSKEFFNVDFEALLGTGAFGCVYRGNIRGSDKQLAFKITNESTCSTLALKGLLSEIKVLSYLGRHEHVVQLVGAYTAELRKGIMYVVTELCDRGSLETHLRKRCVEVEGYVSVHPDTDQYTSISQCNSGNLQSDMLRWSLEIASGMKFITSKNVVHADLATRNVLLTSSYTAKISDFGLSRRMYNYTQYVKNQEEPMPWRWMSIEALKHLTFSEKSDVWAFGCTMWEIFSCGNVPYSGLSWSVSFVEELQKGLRLQRPEHASEEIYNLMLQCWRPVSSDRVNFRNLEDLLRNIWLNMVNCED